jgi:hypothetical protein
MFNEHVLLEGFIFFPKKTVKKVASSPHQIHHPFRSQFKID